MADRQRMPFQVAASLSAALGALSLLLTAIGLYSVASYSVTQRRREIGVHLALGATPANVVRRILRESIRSVAAGAAVGLPISLALSHWAASSVLRIETYDPLAYLAVPSLLAMITLLATALPARRAARTDPMVALREE
jgi:ABC-type antimicrobial peptide transport system permease subunit